MGRARRLPRRALSRARPGRQHQCVSCQLCEFVCPPKAIKIIPPGPAGPSAVPPPPPPCVSCQLCEFVCPPKAIKITPPGPASQLADRPNAEKMPAEFEINMLRCIFCGFCQEVCPEEAIFLQKDYSLTGTSRKEMIYNKEKLLALGGVHGGIQKWKHKLEEAREQENFPVKG